MYEYFLCFCVCEKKIRKRGGGGTETKKGGEGAARDGDGRDDIIADEVQGSHPE